MIKITAHNARDKAKAAQLGAVANALALEAFDNWLRYGGTAETALERITGDNVIPIHDALPDDTE